MYVLYDNISTKINVRDVEIWVVLAPFMRVELCEAAQTSKVQFFVMCNPFLASVPFLYPFKNISNLVNRSSYSKVLRNKAVQVI